MFGSSSDKIPSCRSFAPIFLRQFPDAAKNKDLYWVLFRFFAFLASGSQKIILVIQRGGHLLINQPSSGGHRNEREGWINSLNKSIDNYEGKHLVVEKIVKFIYRH